MRCTRRMRLQKSKNRSLKLRTIRRLNELTTLLKKGLLAFNPGLVLRRGLEKVVNENFPQPDDLPA